MGGGLQQRCQGVAIGEQAAAQVNVLGVRVQELGVLSIGLSVGVLDTQLFGVMVVMALVTTSMTGPLLTALMPEASPAWRAADVPDAARTPR